MLSNALKCYFLCYLINYETIALPDTLPHEIVYKRTWSSGPRAGDYLQDDIGGVGAKKTIFLLTFSNFLEVIVRPR